MPSYSTNNNVYYLGLCEICKVNEGNALFSCLTVGYCEDCVVNVRECPNCEKPEDIIILTFSDYGRRLNVRTIKNSQSE